MTEHNKAAVVFDWTAFRAWLELPSSDGQTKNGAAIEPFATGFQPGADEAGWLTEAALNAVREATVGDGIDVWSTGQGVGNVYVWTVTDPEGGQSGICGEVIVDGVPLSLGKLDDDELVQPGDTMIPGWEAAEQVLNTLADQVNAVVVAFRKATAPDYEAFGELSVADIRTALTALTALFTGDADLLEPAQVEVTERVAAMWQRYQMAGTDAEVVEAEIVDNDVADV